AFDSDLIFMTARSGQKQAKNTDNSSIWKILTLKKFALNRDYKLPPVIASSLAGSLHQTSPTIINICLPSANACDIRLSSASTLEPEPEPRRPRDLCFRLIRRPTPPSIVHGSIRPAPPPLCEPDSGGIRRP